MNTYSGNGLTLSEWLQQESFTLTLGSGFFGFFAHCGVLRALLDSNLRPAALTGSSSGSLIAGCYASGLTIENIESILFSLDRKSFWDPGLGFGLLKGEKFRCLLREVLPSHVFESCPIPLRLSVYNQKSKKAEVWQTGDLIAAIYASCALPILFQPLKRHKIYYLDGGVKDRPALHGVAENERVLIHHLASKSPWRRAGDPELIPPQRDNGTTLVLDNLTRTSPFKLHTGRLAYEEARTTTAQLLQLPWNVIMRKSTQKNSTDHFQCK